jgi:NAD+ synthetase
VRLALAQINTTIGDLSGNVDRAARALSEAASRGADLVVLPELTLSGYPPLDLVDRTAFVRANTEALERLAREAPAQPAVVGFVGQSDHDTGKAATNAAAVLVGGRIVAVRTKTLLPTYDVFDESRHFQPAAANEPVDIAGLPVGITICEDMWNDRLFWPRPLYGVDPVEGLAAAGAKLLLNLSASPFSAGKQGFRREMLAATARRHGVPLGYVNLVGGNDQLIFDGRSLVFDAEGRILAEGKAFEEDIVVVGLDAPPLDPPAALPDDISDIRTALELGLRDYVRKCGLSRVVFGLSGGIDSALTAALAASALGPANVTAIYMPSTFSSDLSGEDASRLAGNLGIDFHIVPIERMRASAEGSLEPLFMGTEPGVAEENIQARLRGMIVMAYANKHGCLPLATGNKSELAVGYCTLYGDMVGGLAVIGDLPKTTVYRLAEHFNKDSEIIPRSTVERAPSAELKLNQTDQDILPPYDVLDGILNLYIEKNCDLDEIVAAGYEPETVREVLRMVDRAEFKRRQAPITLRVTGKAFGSGRRLPVAQRWPR